MGDPVRGKLGQALSKIDRPGSFCTSGSEPAFLPGLEVTGIGPIALPLVETQAKELIAQCEQAPHGQGAKTLVDTKVRRVWRLKPDRFKLTNPAWDGFLARIVGRVQEALGLDRQPLESHLYDLLLYERGDFFLPHRDGEKLDRMVATLVVVLPSAHEGGELIVRHDGGEQTIDFGGGASPHDIHFAAFYADCEHEVRPLRKGHRLCLVYNLTLAKSRSKQALAAPRASEHIETIAGLLRAWSSDEGAEKLVVLLDHAYTRDGLVVDALKGVDRARAQVLFDAARQAGCKAYLGLLTFWESGSCMDDSGGHGYGYGRRHRWSRWNAETEKAKDKDDESIEGRYRMEEVYDSSLTADHFSDREGEGLPVGELTIDQDDLVDPEALRSVKPDEEHEGYTGNEGMTLERWYRHAAIVLWPEHRHFDVLCDRDSRNVVPVLGRMIQQARRSKRAAAEALKAQCVELATRIVARWPHGDFVRETEPWSLRRRVEAEDETPKGEALFDALVALDEPRLLRAYFGEVMLQDVAVEPGKPLVALLQGDGCGPYSQELQAVMKATTNESLERNVRLLERACSAKPRRAPGWAGLCEALARELVTALEAIDTKRASTDWRARDVKRSDVLAGMARSLLLTGQDALLARFIDHVLGLPKLYPLRPAHIEALEALRPWIKKHVKTPSPALARWLTACREQFEALTAELPQEPKDFRREDPIKCSCKECAELKQFLRDPKEQQHRFRMREERRRHLENEIYHTQCDLDTKTETKGSPHTLICTKNTASYKKALKTYHDDLAHLATVRAIEGSLPE